MVLEARALPNQVYWLQESMLQAFRPAMLRISMDYENMRVLEQIRGLLFGRPMEYTPQERQELREVILERTRQYDSPIISDMDFGHTSPMFTLPLGCMAVIDTTHKRFEIAEAAVC